MIDWYWKEVDTLEAKRKWKEAKDYMLSEWKRDSQNLKKFIRLGFLCWYVVVEWACIDKTNLKHDEYEHMLKELTNFGLNNFESDADFLWTFGYMISLFPFYFGDYEEWEVKGYKMLEKAYKLRPNDPVIKLIYFGSKLDAKHKKEYQDTCHIVTPILKSRFRGDGGLQQYFKQVLNREK
jgi:hypothetical protein